MRRFQVWALKSKGRRSSAAQIHMLCVLPPLDFPIQQRFLYLANGAGHIDFARTGFDAVKYGAAAPHAFDGIQHFHSFLASLVTGVKEETMGVDDGRRSNVIAVSPE
jgi:hypothetical protein